jgi:hypothetical protein
MAACSISLEDPAATPALFSRFSTPRARHPTSLCILQIRRFSAGSSATFTVQASGAPPLSFRWQRNGADIPGATAWSFTLQSAQLSDDGALFRCVVSNAFGSATSNEARLTVVANQPPTATITQPAAGTLYTAGQTINFSGTGGMDECGRRDESPRAM